VHPQPWAARIHALLWGATITVLVGALVNTAAEGVFGESVAAVAVAPFVEETMKGLGVLWAVRRREVEGAMDGIAVATHALLNGAWEVAGVRLSPVGIALYLALLIPVAIWVISARRKQADQFIAAIPALPQRYALPPTRGGELRHLARHAGPPSPASPRPAPAIRRQAHLTGPPHRAARPPRRARP
jgi:hypothetical protein